MERRRWRSEDFTEEAREKQTAQRGEESSKRRKEVDSLASVMTIDSLDPPLIFNNLLVANGQQENKFGQLIDAFF